MANSMILFLRRNQSLFPKESQGIIHADQFSNMPYQLCDPYFKDITCIEQVHAVQSVLPRGTGLATVVVGR